MNLDAFILIGGKSSRFGRDKAFFPVGGRPLAAMMAEKIRIAFPDVRVNFIASFRDQFDENMLATLPGPAIFDVTPGKGSWSGLHTALSCSSSSWALILACDLPNVSPDLLKMMYSKASSEVDAIAPVQADGRLQPFCSFYRRASVLPRVEEIISTEELPPLHRIFQDVATHIIALEDYEELPASSSMFTNVNYPPDVLEIRP